MTQPPQPIPYQDSPAAQRLVQESRERELSSLTARERAVEISIGGGFLVAAVSMLIAFQPSRPFHWAVAAVAIAALVAASRVEFEVGSCYTMPLPLVVVPMLFLLPPEMVPLCVAAGLMIGRLPGSLAGHRPPGRVLTGLGDSWFSVGPALVFAIAAPGPPDGHDWPVYVLALAAQFVVDIAASSIRERLNGGATLKQQLEEIRWIHLVDALLSAPALAIAFAATQRPWMMLLALPLVALMLVFSRERRARIDNALELGRAYRGTAMVLGNVVEADDEYTGFHSEGVVALAVEVADELGLDALARRNVEFGALLHDVGKIVIPKEIINKPGKLDAHEWEVIKTHTVEGQKLLDQVGGFMREVGMIVRASHERYDGAGYPDGLAGEEIPLEARIVACCDAFSAITTDRSYRPARTPEVAIEELRRCAGTQFDPRVVEATVRVAERQFAAATEARLARSATPATAAPALRTA